jgi:hypothetical protein
MSFRVSRAFLTAAFAAIASCGALAAPSRAQADGPTVVAITFGNPNDVPITGDWTGSGATQIGVYRPSNDTFYLGDTGGASNQSFTFGNPNDVPITGDWDGSGRTQIGVYRPSDDTFYLGDTGGVSNQSITFGNPGDIPITGDWTGIGQTQIGVYRPSTDTFYLREIPKPPPPPPPPPAQAVTTVPTPPAGRPGHRRVRVRITIDWRWAGMRTRVVKVEMSRLPRRARIMVKCTGRGCPLTRRHARAAHVKVLLHRLAGTTYRAGDVISITISAPGRVAERARITIRDGRKPLAALV